MVLTSRYSGLSSLKEQNGQIEQISPSATNRNTTGAIASAQEKFAMGENNQSALRDEFVAGAFRFSNDVQDPETISLINLLIGRVVSLGVGEEQINRTISEAPFESMAQQIQIASILMESLYDATRPQY